MPPTTTGLIWDEATASGPLGLARAFESAWNASSPGRRPEPDDFLKADHPDRPAHLLAILRADIVLRRKAGEDARPERYRERFPGLRGDALVALLYEDFCLREEAGESPDPADYRARFPEVEAGLREVLDIHELVAEPGSTSREDDPTSIAFPEAGETIAGFRLVEELGRGSFARVFLAQERQLADRLVALKVSRTGSREPQTLARLQHTHIVPVHSYRIDPITGLHLLCMPYFGRVTLARLLAEPSLREPDSGACLVAALDRIGGPSSPGSGPPKARASLSRRSFPRAVAWWGARMAEGLQHAHDRGVLHRDVKPSNVLIAGDGMPMLLDFNLAREAESEGIPRAGLGGTLAYMAPEHLEALSEGDDGGIDHRADLYSLGMVLSEALGSKPIASPSEAATLADSLTWLLDHRRREAPGPAEGAVAIPSSLEAVLRRCLAPDPDARYASAADLAVDLQAVADDAPLTFALEPWPPRAARWLRANRTRLAVAVPVALAVVGLVALLFQAQAESIRREDGARESIRDGIRSAGLGHFQAAEAQFGTALAMIEGRADLRPLRDEAIRRREAVEASRRVRDLAEALFVKAEPLRFALLGFVGDRADASRALPAALDPFGVLDAADWTSRADLRLLDAPRRARLVREVDDLLFFWIVRVAMDAKDRRAEGPSAVAICDRALRFTDRQATWSALRGWWSDPAHRRPSIPDDPSRERSAAACFRWYLLGKLVLEADSTLAWLERADRLEPQEYWHQFALTFEHAEAGRVDRALPPCNAAVALRPDSPWARRERADLLALLGRWGEALEDLGEALESCRSSDSKARVHLDRGLIRRRLGDFAGARSDFESAIAVDPGGRTSRDARRNLAGLEADSGATGAALDRYEALVASDPADIARRARVRLLIRMGRADRADDDLEFLIGSAPPDLRPQLLAERAAGRLAEDRPAEAEVDASEAFRLDPSATNAGLLDRARLAAGKAPDRWPDRPDGFDAWPDGGPTLRADLRAAAGRLDPGDRPGRAVLLSAALDHRAALDEADRLVAESPRSPDARLLRARVRFRARRFRGAMEDATAALAESPEDPELIELRGMIRVESGDHEKGLVDLKVAEDRGLASAVGPRMARALSALGRERQAAETWTRICQANPRDVRAYLGLAKSRRRLKEWDRSFVALEAAASLVDDRSPLLGQVALGYAACLPSRPDRLPRLLNLCRRMAGGRLD